MICCRCAHRLLAAQLLMHHGRDCDSKSMYRSAACSRSTTSGASSYTNTAHRLQLAQEHASPRRTTCRSHVPAPTQLVLQLAQEHKPQGRREARGRNWGACRPCSCGHKNYKRTRSSHRTSCVSRLWLVACGFQLPKSKDQRAKSMAKCQCQM